MAQSKYAAMDSSLGAPENFYDLLIVPMLAVFFGLLVRFLGWNKHRMGQKSATWNIIAVIVLSIGVYAGARTVWNLYDPELGSFYRETIWQRRMLYSHYAALLLPLLALVGVLVWNLIERRLGRPLLLSS
jgi:hypothetical protein